MTSRSEYKLCQCPQRGCIELNTRDSVTGKPIRGIYLSNRTWKEHNSTPIPIEPKAKEEEFSYNWLHLTELQLRSLIDDVQYHIDHFPKCHSLSFVTAPTSSIEFVSRNRIEHAAKCREPSDLLLGSPENSGYLRMQNYIHSITTALDQINVVEDALLKSLRTVCLDALYDAHKTLEGIREVQWRSQALEESRPSDQLGCSVVVTEPYMSPGWLTASPLKTTCCLFLSLLNGSFNVSEEVTKFAASALRDIMTMALSLVDDNAPYVEHVTSSSIPLDPSTALSHLHIEPQTTAYVCCPKCFALYFEEYNDDRTPLFPQTCSAQETKNSPICNSPLTTVRNVLGRQYVHPVRRFLVQDMTDFMLRMISRPGMEELMDSALESQFGPTPALLRSIWDAQQVRNFVDIDGSRFFHYKGLEGRYLFSLFYDHFNPLGNKTAGKQVSVGAIYMICLNLPPHLMYLQENVFLVAVIPGPNKPSLTQINHLMRPIIDQLLLFWDPGVWFTSTPKSPDGRLIRLVVIPLVADALAARQMGGFGAHNSNFFCIWCGLCAADIDNVDPETWPPRRSAEVRRKLALQWLC